MKKQFQLFLAIKATFEKLFCCTILVFIMKSDRTSGMELKVKREITAGPRFYDCSGEINCVREKYKLSISVCF